jgi:hypothetical protein
MKAKEACGWIFLVAICATFPFLVRSWEEKLVRESMANTFYHEPATGCGDGHKRIASLFADRKGLPVAGCFNANGNGRIDRIRPGEAIRLGLEQK